MTPPHSVEDYVLLVYKACNHYDPQGPCGVCWQKGFLAYAAAQVAQARAEDAQWACSLCHCCGEQRHDGGEPCVSCETARAEFTQMIDARVAHYTAKHAAHLQDDEESWWRARKVEAAEIAAAIRART